MSSNLIIATTKNYEQSNMKKFSEYFYESYQFDKNGKRLFVGDKVLYYFENTSFPEANGKIATVIRSCGNIFEIKFDFILHSGYDSLDTSPNQSCTKIDDDINQYEEWDNMEENYEQKFTL